FNSSRAPWPRLGSAVEIIRRIRTAIRLVIMFVISSTASFHEFLFLLLSFRSHERPMQSLVQSRAGDLDSQQRLSLRGFLPDVRFVAIVLHNAGSDHQHDHEAHNGFGPKTKRK